MKSLFDSATKFSPLLLGFPAGINILRDVTTPQSNFDASGILLNAAMLLVAVLLTRWAQRISAKNKTTEEDHKALEKKVDNAVSDEASARENIGNQVSVLGETVATLKKEVQAVSGERDKFKEAWGSELVAHSKTKTRLNEEIEQLVDINNKQHDNYIELKGRFDVLERKVEAQQSVEALAQTILAGMGQTIGQAVGQAVSQALAAYSMSSVPQKLSTSSNPIAAIPSSSEMVAPTAT